MATKLKAPFPWFGGKSRVSDLVWERFGDTVNYVEPFFGSGAVLLMRPHQARNETINDLDCHVANFWRAVRQDPDGVAAHADWPVNEADLHARHHWIHDQAAFRDRMHDDPDHFNAKVAGWWVWGISAWIGDNWCRTTRQKSAPCSIDQGVHVIHNDGTGLDRRRPNLQAGSMGIHGKRPQVKKGGAGVNASRASGGPGPLLALTSYMRELSDRLRRVRVCCGDWSRILGPSPTVHIGTTAVFLDPPYGVDDRDKVYSQDSLTVAGDVLAWCLDHGPDKRLRIALCGYAGEHDVLADAGWSIVMWKATGGYGNRSARGKVNRHRERIWFSPGCLQPEQGTLF